MPLLHHVVSRVVPLVATLVLSSLGPVGVTQARAADGLPYVDPGVTGTIGLCDVDGRPVLSGRVRDKPFVWLAVGSSASPPPYDAAGRTAFLAVYQPRKGVDPGEWSGYPLAASSRYSNPRHAMSQATPLSGSLQDFLGRYPPAWDGLVQLRMILAGSNRSPRTANSDATDLRITGDTWQVVRGGNAPCSAGTAVSSTVLLKVPGAAGTPRPGAVSSRPPVTSGIAPQLVNGTPVPSSAAVLPGVPEGTPTTGHASSGPGPTAARPKAGVAGASSTTLVVGGLLALVAAALLTAFAVRRRPGQDGPGVRQVKRL